MYILICALVLATPLAWSADETSATSDGSSSVPQTNLQSFGPPPEFRAMAMMQMGNMLSCTTTPLLQNLGAIATDGLKGAAKQAAGGACGGSEYVPNMDNVKCDSFKNRGTGEFSFARWEEEQKKLEASAASVACKKGQIEGMQNQLSCLSTQADMLAQQVAALQSSYTQNIQRMQQDVAKLTSIEEDRKAQLKDVTGKLTGDGVSGGKGLLGLREEMQKAISGMPRQVQEIKEAQMDMERQRKALEEMAENRTVVLANTCFTRPRPSFKCVPNGPPVNAREYVLCRYKQNQHVGPSGVIEEGTLADKQADSKGKELETVLDAIVEDSPADLGKAKSQEEVQSLANRPVKIMSAADIENRYGAQLASFSGKGLDIRSFVTQTMGNCFAEAKQSVARERKLANSTFAQAQESIKKKERDTVVRVNELLNGYSQLNSEVMAGLTGQHLPLNISACQNAKPEVQANCLTDIRRNMEGLLAGSTPQSTVDILIRGNDPKTNINFRCQGLNGCITYMQNAQRNIQLEVQKVGQFKKDYILKSNQSVEAFTKQMAQMMSTQSQALNTKLKELNSTLAMLGVRPGIDIRPVRGRPMRKGENGLYEMPENVVDLIGGQMNPPMLDVQGDTFASALEGVSRKMEDLGEKEGELSKASNALASLPDECKDELAHRLESDYAELDKCLSNVEDCADINLSPLDRLLTTLGNLNLGTDDVNVSQTLESGMNRCKAIRDDDPRVKLEDYRKCEAAYQTVKARKDSLSAPPTAEQTADLQQARTAAQQLCQGLASAGPIEDVGGAEKAKKNFEDKLKSELGITLTARNSSCKKISEKFAKKGDALADIDRAVGGSPAAKGL